MAHTGKPGKPVVILIHGLGMNRNIWDGPDREKYFFINRLGSSEKNMLL